MNSLTNFFCCLELSLLTIFVDQARKSGNFGEPRCREQSWNWVLLDVQVQLRWSTIQVHYNGSVWSRRLDISQWSKVSLGELEVQDNCDWLSCTVYGQRNTRKRYDDLEIEEKRKGVSWSQNMKLECNNIPHQRGMSCHHHHDVQHLESRFLFLAHEMKSPPFLLPSLYVESIFLVSLRRPLHISIWALLKLEWKFT